METSPIVLTTDFGLNDPYVGVMKGVILRINSHAAVVDLTHNIQPQNVRQAAFLLGTSHRFFPQGAIHAAVVDPGVGTDRRSVLLVTPAAKFIAPDNGLLSQVLSAFLDEPPSQPGRVFVPDGLEAYHLTNDEYWLHPLSNTFHGRDVFAPVAAHLSLGAPPSAFGPPVQELEWSPIPQPVAHVNSVEGEVVYVDHFGNLVTNVPIENIAGWTNIVTEINGVQVHGLSRTFHSPEPLENESARLIGGSLGYLEIAVPDGHAAAALGVTAGGPVRISHSPSDQAPLHH